MTQKVAYVVMSESGQEILKHVGWIGIQMEPFVEQDVFSELKISNLIYEHKCDSHDTIQFFESKEHAKEAVDKYREWIVKRNEIFTRHKNHMPKLKLAEFEIEITHKVLEEI